MNVTLRLLIIEDSERDVALEVRALEAAGYRVNYEVAETAAEMKATLIKQAFDIVISDHNLPQFDAPGALAVLKQSGMDIPFIIVSGAIGEETAVALMKAGAHDYVMKDKLSRLVPAVQRELKEAESRVQRKQADEALRESEDKFRVLADSTPTAVMLYQDDRWIYANKAAETICGYSEKELLAMNFWDIVHPDFKPLIKERGKMRQEGKNSKIRYELKIITKNGTEKWVDLSGASTILQGRAAGIINVLDITDRKRAEEALKESEKKYRLLADNVHDVIFVLDMNLKYTYVSPSVKILRGYEPEEVMKQTPSEILTPSSMDLAMKSLAESLELEKTEHREINISRTLQLEMIRKDGTTVWTEVTFSAIRDKNQQPVGILGITRDITERKRAEEELRDSEAEQRWLLDSMTNAFVVFESIFDEQGKFISYRFQYINKAYERITGVRNEEVKGKTVHEVWPATEDSWIENYGEVAVTGITKEFNMYHSPTKKLYSCCVYRPWDTKDRFCVVFEDITDRKRAEDKLRESEANYRQLFDNAPALIYRVDFKSGKFVKANDVFCEYLGCSQEEITSLNPYDILTEESKKLFLERMGKISQGVKVPEIVEYEVLDKKGNRWRLELHNKNIYDAEGHLIASDVVAHDITERKQTEEELYKTLESLRKAIGTTIQVMVAAIEVRDPYTAGHQIRVADLARAIAMEMGLPKNKIEGLRMAGSIHDIGKLSIPAEILSKPTKLTNIEFSLIKEHSQIGYEMLKDVESPWPLAQIVYQHHERMNGSGYPRNLKGDEILMEARIMAVADVVEAMASHRPYRAALGIEVALEEIEKNKGIFYDDVVADACLRLFREKGYQIT